MRVSSVFALIPVCAATAAAFNFGSIFLRIGELTSPLRAKTISNSYHESALGTGQLMSDVNAFNGQSAYSISLGKVDLRGKLTWPLDLAYGGNTRLIVDADNRVSPSGWVGLGWSMETPYVAVNHKGTFASVDDLIFVNLGGEGGGQLLQKNGRFFIANNPFIKVSARTATAGDLAGQFEEWTFELPSGVKYVMGEADGAVSNSERIVYYTGTLIQVSPFTLAAAKPFIYRWDLRKIEDPEGANRIQFKYRSFAEPVFPGASRAFTREAYVDTIRWSDRLGNPAEEYVFTVAAKTADEWQGDDAFSPRTSQRPVETRFLDKITCRMNGKASHEIRFSYALAGSGKYTKRLLTRVQGFHNHPTSSVLPLLQPSRPWVLAYKGAAFHYMLESVRKPSGAEDAFQYRAFAAGDFFPYGMQSPFDDTMKTLAGGSLAPVIVPASQDERDKWQNAAQCDELFCYSSVVTNDPGATGQRLYAEVRHNPGNYFDSSRVARLHGVSDGTPNDWALYPAGDYLVLANHIQGRVFPFAWDGLGFDSIPLDPGPVDNPGGLPNFFGNPTGPDQGLAVLPSEDFLLVHKRGSRNRTWVFVRDGSGPSGQGFRRLNQGAACDLDNSNAFGEAVKDASDGCLEWHGSDNVQISMGPHLVTMVHDPTDIIFAFAPNKSGTGFVDLSSSFVAFDPSIHHAGFPNNWQRNIEDIRHGPDYFIVKSVEGAQGRLDVMHFDGSAIRRAAFSGWHGNGAGEKLMAFPADDYFLEANHTTGQIVYWKKRVTADGAGLFFEPHVVRSDWNADAMDLRVHVYPGSFTLEYFPNDQVSKAGRPLREAAVPAGTCQTPSGQAEDFRSYLYQITRDLPGEFLDRSGDLRISIGGCATKLYDVAFSASDNFLDGLTAREPGNASAACTETNSTCDVYRRTAKVRMLASPAQAYLYDQEGVNLPDFGTARSRHDLFAEAARLGMASDISATKLRVLQRFYAYDGRDFFGAPDNLYYVEKVVQRDGVGQELATAFSYDIREYNCYSQSPMFELASISPSGDRPMGRIDLGFHLDLADVPLVGRRLKLNGVVRFQRSWDSRGGLISTTIPAYLGEDALAASLPADWPVSISINRLVSQSTVLGKGPGLRVAVDSFLVYDNGNGQAHFTKSLRSGRWHVSQSIFTDTGLVKQNIDYVFPVLQSQPGGPPLSAASAAAPLDPFRAIASVKNEYETAAPFVLRADSLWRDADESLTDADLRAGKEPALDLREGWVPKDQTSRRNAEVQPLELKAFRGGATPVYTSVFYEGRRADPVGKVFNSRLANCALLLGENGGVPGLSTLDWEGRWEKPGTVFSAAQAHTGAYSLKVTDDYGPTVNLFLEGVRQEGSGFLASAWIYAGPGINPVFRVERRTAAGVLVDFVDAAPVGGSKIDRRWQRWEARLSASQLTAGNLFNGNADYLRIWAGTGAPAGNSARILYVDDIVLRPDRSDFALSTYNFQGKPTAKTDSHHLVNAFEYDFRGIVTATRDDRQRMLGQSARHELGEDD